MNALNWLKLDSSDKYLNGYILVYFTRYPYTIYSNVTFTSVGSPAIAQYRYTSWTDYLNSPKLPQIPITPKSWHATPRTQGELPSSVTLYTHLHLLEMFRTDFTHARLIRKPCKISKLLLDAKNQILELLLKFKLGSWILCFRA